MRTTRRAAIVGSVATAVGLVVARRPPTMDPPWEEGPRRAWNVGDEFEMDDERWRVRTARQGEFCRVLTVDRISPSRSGIRSPRYFCPAV